MTDAEWLAIQVGLWSEGKQVAHRIRHVLRGQPRLDSYWTEYLRLPGLESAAWDYRLQLRGRGSAGPEDWLALSLSLFGIDGSVLGPVDIPAMLYRRAWPVPSVTHLPCPWGSTVYTVTLDVPDQHPDDDPMLTCKPLNPGSLDA